MNPDARTVDQVLGEVVALLDRFGRIDPVVVVEQVGVELVGLTLEEAVEPVESCAGTASGPSGLLAEQVKRRAQVPLARPHEGMSA